jgi:hypothetical protein
MGTERGATGIMIRNEAQRIRGVLLQFCNFSVRIRDKSLCFHYTERDFDRFKYLDRSPIYRSKILHLYVKKYSILLKLTRASSIHYYFKELQLSDFYINDKCYTGLHGPPTRAYYIYYYFKELCALES